MFLPESCLIVPHARARGNCGETIKQIRQPPHHKRARQRRRFAERCGQRKAGKKEPVGERRSRTRELPVPDAAQRRHRRGAEAAPGTAQRRRPARRRGYTRHGAEAAPRAAQRQHPVWHCAAAGNRRTARLPCGKTCGRPVRKEEPFCAEPGRRAEAAVPDSALPKRADCPACDAPGCRFAPKVPESSVSALQSRNGTCRQPLTAGRDARRQPGAAHFRAEQGSGGA